MKLKLIFALVLLTASLVYGQGTLLVDQQSTNSIEGAAFLQSGQPMGQSFIPTLSSVSFVLLNLYDSDVENSLGSTVFVNLRSNSITGPVLSSTTPVFMADNFFGITNFVFSTSVNVVAGVTYYLQPVIESGDTMGAYVTDGSYLSGTLISEGAPVSGRNLWFQEGVITVPEPSTIALGLLGFGSLAFLSARKRRA